MGETLSDLPFFGKYMETQATVYNTDVIQDFASRSPQVKSEWLMIEEGGKFSM